MPMLIRDGGRLFGGDAAAYDTVRPPYPEALYQFLVGRGALAEGTRTLELGAGTGLATRRLLALGARPLTVVESDERFAPYLKQLAVGRDMTVVTGRFEAVALPAHAFDLAVAATSFHWLDADSRCRRIGEVLRLGGHAALLYNVFGVLGRADPFHDASVHLLAPLEHSPSNARGDRDLPFALDHAARDREFAESGLFGPGAWQAETWELTLTPVEVGLLYATFSQVQQLPAPERRTLLDRLMTIAADEFDGRVTRNMTSIVYLWQRRA